ncbi:MAG: DNA polymerase III subunit gamma/tau [Pseudonocardiales bacterium]|nr:MAG: DNA polymerase III subunit gamma/tau [Pseudonocardiales bacterium]
MADNTGVNLALYRKYRSATFAEVIGQEHVTEPLRHALSNSRINHAYLFSGPRGCGKTSSARILARSLNCIQGPTPDPCGVCDSCRELAPNGPGSIDVIEIDAASHGGVDDARDLRERAFFAPVRDRYKVYIIDEAHMVTTQGFNALLKLVEEPPDFLVFVFATTEPDKVLTTIRSRTHHYPFRLIPPGAMRAHLEKICTAESITVEPPVLPLVVRAGGGSARDSLSILDQLLAGAGPDGVTYARAVALLGVTDGALIDDMVDALAAGDAAAVYGTIDRVVEAGHDPRRFASDLLDRFRDLILLDAVPEAAARGLIDAPQDAAAHMSDQATRLGGGTVTRYAEIVHTALIEMRGTTSPRLVLELLCARMQLPDAATDSAALLQRLERLERRYTAAGSPEPTAEASAAATPKTAPTKPAPTAPRPPAAKVAPGAAAPSPAAPDPASQREPWPTAPAKQAPEPAGAAPAAKTPPPPEVPPAEQASSGVPGELDAAALRRLWPEVLDIVKLSSRRTRALLDNAQITAAVGDLITLSAPAALAKMLADESNTSVLRTALTKVVGGTWRIDVDGSGSTGPAAVEAPEPAQRPGPEPDPRDDTEIEAPGERAAEVDPEVEALRLLQDQLGARPVDEK